MFVHIDMNNIRHFDVFIQKCCFWLYLHQTVNSIGCALQMYITVKFDHSIREACKKMMQQLPSRFHNERAEFLPVEWRSNLTLDGGMPNY